MSRCTVVMLRNEQKQTYETKTTFKNDYETVVVTHKLDVWSNITGGFLKVRNGPVIIDVDFDLYAKRIIDIAGLRPKSKLVDEVATELRKVVPSVIEFQV